MHNHFNLTGIIKDIDKNNPVAYTWEGNEHEEKGSVRKSKMKLWRRNGHENVHEKGIATFEPKQIK